LLESAEGPRRLAQYSFIGFSPSKIIEAKNGNYRETNSEGASATTHAVAPLSLLRKVLVENYTTYRGFRFVGGVVGYLSYDSVRYLESIPNHTRDDLKFPDFEFGIYDDGIVFDHLAS
jgi:anthranilate synthase component 1